MYQIVESYPIHCQITDGIIGTEYRRLPMVYRNPRLAQVLANRWSDAAYEGCGDNLFHVVELGAAASRRSMAGYLDRTAHDEEIPF